MTNQLALLDLPEELQAMLSAGTLPERDGRSLARHFKDHPELDAVALLDHLHLTKAATAEAKERERAVLEAAKETQVAPAGARLSSADNKADQPKAIQAEPERSSNLLSADNKPTEQTPAPAPTSAAVERGVASDDGKPTESSSPLPGQRHDLDASAAEETKQQEDNQPRKLPYDDPAYVALHLERKMTPPDFVVAARVMVMRSWDKAGQEPSLELLKEMLSVAAQRDPDSLRTLLDEFSRQTPTA
ncbi:hypothetical protein QA862_43130 [Streptomyces sp. B21-101]